MTDPTPRWKYRAVNYRRAFSLLREALDQERELSQLEKEGLIQRFEYTMELAWKSMKDYLEYENMILDQITPRTVIRRAYEAGLIHQGSIWQAALDARNRMSHTYNFEDFEQVIAELRTSYVLAFEEWDDFLLTRSDL